MENEILTPSLGFRHLAAVLGEGQQKALLGLVDAIVREAPFFTPRMPRSGQPFSVRMTNCGVLGWVSDTQGGYRYQTLHPETGRVWPPIPPLLLDLWRTYSMFEGSPEACLINHYPAGARMGSHRDTDEREPRAPVLSISLGDQAIFHIGGVRRSDPKRRILLQSGDIVVIGGGLRFAYHGIDRIVAGSSSLVAGGGRISLTLRRVTPTT